jgi:uncharacterized membrane protein
VAVVLALITALSYGIGDFTGGLAARRAPSLQVTATAHTIGLLGLTVAALAVGAEQVTGIDLAWGAASGLAGCVGIVLLYRALAEGVMSVVSPVTAVVGAAVPVVVGLATGDRPGPLAVLGIAVALVAITLVSRSGPVGHVTPHVLMLALGSGLGFGMFFVAVAQIDEAAGLWPLALGRVVSVTAAVGLGIMRAQRPFVPRTALALSAVAGVLDVLANVSYLYATQAGMLSVVAVIAALYPAGTVLLAMTVTHERLSRVQAAGLGAAGASLVLVAL